MCKVGARHVQVVVSTKQMQGAVCRVPAGLQGTLQGMKFPDKCLTGNFIISIFATASAVKPADHPSSIATIAYHHCLTGCQCQNTRKPERNLALEQRTVHVRMADQRIQVELDVAASRLPQSHECHHR
jgi:hypothetical protein